MRVPFLDDLRALGADGWRRIPLVVQLLLMLVAGFAAAVAVHRAFASAPSAATAPRPVTTRR